MAGEHGPLVIERILRDRNGIWRQIIEQRGLKQLTGQMLATSAVALAVYGAVLGFNNGWLQALLSMAKLPILFLVTLAICLPTLYLFNLVLGAKLSVTQAVSLVMVTITVMSTLTLAFAPISLFFLITANDYNFFKLLNVAILVLSAVVGLKFLTSGMQALNAHREAQAWADVRARAKAEGIPEPEPVPVPVPVLVPPPGPAQQVAMMVPGQHPQQFRLPQQQVRQQPQLPPGERPASMGLLYIWILLFGFVGTQLAWTLRPFFGDPGQDFQLFRHIEGSFYADIFRTIGHLF